MALLPELGVGFPSGNRKLAAEEEGFTRTLTKPPPVPSFRGLCSRLVSRAKFCSGLLGGSASLTKGVASVTAVVVWGAEVSNLPGVL